MRIDLRGMTFLDKKKAMLNKVRQIKQAAGMDRLLKDIGVTRTDLPQLSKKALRDPCLVTNPRRASQRDLEVIYEESL
jgi:alcohol dehydrogenase